MKKTIAIAVACMLMCGTVSAGTITWTTTDLSTTDQTFVSTDGTGLLAFNGTDLTSGSVTVNGVAFTNNNTNTFTQNGITYTATGTTPNTDAFGGAGAASPILDLVQGAHFNVESFDITGLTIGSTYQLQILANDARGGRADWDIGFNDGTGGTTVAVVGDLSNGGDGLGDSFLGTFTATATNQEVTLTATRAADISVGDAITTVPNGGQRQINAFQLREITAVPEPSSMIVLSLGSLLCLRRRR